MNEAIKNLLREAYEAAQTYSANYPNDRPTVRVTHFCYLMTAALDRIHKLAANVIAQLDQYGGEYYLNEDLLDILPEEVETLILAALAEANSYAGAYYLRHPDDGDHILRLKISQFSYLVTQSVTRLQRIANNNRGNVIRDEILTFPDVLLDDWYLCGRPKSM
jgi:hypothetical protein